MRRRARLLFSVLATLGLPAGVGGCDFGTLDDISSDVAAQGTDETTKQALSLWRAFDPKATDADVKKSLLDIDGIVTRAGGIPVQVTIGDLEKSDLELIGFGAKDAAKPQGMLIITELDCTFDQIQALVVASNQPEIYPGTYEKYARTFQGDTNGFLGGAASTLVWKTQYTATIQGNTYESLLTGGARRVPSAAPSGAPILLARTILDQPARFVSGGDVEFNQDYQMELYYPRGNKILHFYAVWREFRLGGLNSESQLYINLVLGNLVDYDVRTSKVCRDKNPLPTFK